ncbi:MAG: polysaccharide pyruvyl transferase family protein [Clostridiales bacterium]|nr:polysaccharide pyruvyl transferase family protein [Clostridiales bacterium]
MFFSNKTKKIPANEIKLYYYDYPNVGDLLNVILVEQLFNKKVIKEMFSTADMIAIGSILDRLLSNGIVGKDLAKLRINADPAHKIHIWGAGLMFPYKNEQRFIRPVEIHALRGKLTADILTKCTPPGENCLSDFVLGDPGLLASKLLKNRPRKIYEIGIIPHYVDAQEPVFKSLEKQYPKSLMIDVKDDPINVLTKIASCKTILSTSLHGLIIADSFHIPNKWCKCSDKILGNGFKYRDYYSAFGVEEKVLDLNEGYFPSTQEIKANYKISWKEVEKKKRDLIQCFPYK